MAKWEYLVLYHHRTGWGRWGMAPPPGRPEHDLEAVLNDYAGEGWEFEALSEVWNGSMMVSTVILKQRVEGGE
ncbi:MAG: hypothetical protein KY468_02185 [Armatimonadetes bacterium]|nr:hypothetical protein [Armatimonadota bacterium]